MTDSMQKIKLSAPQHRAYTSLQDGKWKSAYELGVSIATMGTLVKKGYVKSRDGNRMGAAFSPRTVIKYRRTDIA